MINLTLPAAEAAALINLLGTLPTSSNVYPLLINLVTQYKAQTPAPEVAAPEVAQ